MIARVSTDLPDVEIVDSFDDVGHTEPRAIDEREMRHLQEVADAGARAAAKATYELGERLAQAAEELSVVMSGGGWAAWLREGASGVLG